MTARIYTRVSTLDQSDNYSMAAQKGRAEAWCAYQGIADVAHYPEPAVSGRLNDRPQLTAMLGDLQRGDTVVVYALSRLGRGGAVQMLGIVNRIRDAGARLVSLTESIDTDSPTGRLMLTILAALAELEVELTRERTETGRLQAASVGVFPSSDASLPLGYVRGPDGRVVEGEHADTVRLIFSLAAGGASYRSVSEELARRGVPTPRGGRWSVVQVRRVVLSDCYHTGVLQYRRTVADEAGRIPIPVPPLVDEGVWRDAQRSAALNHVHRNAGKFPLTGHLTCTCGAPLVGRTNMPGGLRYYRCMATVRKTPTCPSNGRADRLWRADRAESSARQELAQLLGDPDALRRLYAEQQAPDTHAEERGALERKLTALVDLYLEGHVDKAAYLARRESLTGQLSALNAPPDVLPDLPDYHDVAASIPTFSNGALSEYLRALSVMCGMLPDGSVRVLNMELPVQ